MKFEHYTEILTNFIKNNNINRDMNLIKSNKHQVFQKQSTNLY